ncbi:MAG: phosphate ABC transporter permease subunit PstC [Clostridiales Family XIII bacterium]|jgi:phosphate transport system permease protein|nr:phosphate ABC transporter permease subunit PstC [Clostridiales Family XIII bacterium]
MKLMKFKEKFFRTLFIIAAAVSIISVCLICVFLFSSGIPTIFKIGPIKFLFGTEWKPSANSFEIFPFILGSIYVTAGAILLGCPIGIITAVFLAKFCPKKLHKILSNAIQLLAGIPSIIFGFFGLVVLVPAIRDIFGGAGKGLLTASVLLAIMILPTIIAVSETALRGVTESYYEGALALGATHGRAVYSVILKAAKSGIVAGVVLGIGRAIGETMAVVMIAGNQPIIPESLTGGLRTLTTNIVLEMGYASGLHRDALIATAVVLFVFILAINILLSLSKKEGAK